VKIQIGDFDFTEVWDGVLYQKLSRYPAVTDWEIRKLLEFVAYEKAHGRECPIICDDENLLAEIRQKMQEAGKYLSASRPACITECTACRHGGCLTDWVCHTTSPENARQILASGWLLSAVRARGLPAETLMQEKRNAAGDPADYFHYVMLAWGNCQAGDRLVMERRLGRFPEKRDLSSGFTPGVRFYFRYEELAKHPGTTFDGVLPMKIRDGIELAEWVSWIVIPQELQAELEAFVPPALKQRVLFVPHQGEDIWEWTEKVYEAVVQTC